MRQPFYFRDEPDNAINGIPAVLRNAAAIIVRSGSDIEEVRRDLACGTAPFAQAADWIMPKHLTRPYDVFSKSSFVFVDSNVVRKEARWTTTTSDNVTFEITVDTEAVLIKAIAISYEDFNFTDHIDSTEYVDLGDGLRALSKVRVGRTMLDSSWTGDSTYAYEYTDWNHPLEPEAFR